MRLLRQVVLSAALCAAACGGPSSPPSPPPFDVHEQTIPELQAAMADGRVTSRQIVAQYLARIEAYDRRGPALRAMIGINGGALDEAAALDRERAETGPRGPLHGIPVVVKDNYDVAGLPTTAGASALAGWHPPDDAFQVARLKEAGAVIIGKANMHELAYGLTTVSSAGGQTRNPYDPSRNPGGSSGGTGAAVAAGFAAAGMGTDTCGSIRVPSSHHALAGLRGTRGLSSRDGIVPLALTQDMGGPMTKTVTDLAIVLDATVGVDPADEVTARGRGRVPDTYTDFLTEGALEGARIGVVTWLVGSAQEDEPVAAVIDAALETIEAAGAEVVEVELPGVPDLLEGASIIPVEFKFQLADYLRAPGAPVRSLREILDSGLYHAAVEERYRRSAAVRGLDDPAYLEALARRRPLREAVTRLMDDERPGRARLPDAAPHRRADRPAAAGQQLRPERRLRPAGHHRPRRLRGRRPAGRPRAARAGVGRGRSRPPGLLVRAVDPPPNAPGRPRPACSPPPRARRRGRRRVRDRGAARRERRHGRQSASRGPPRPGSCATPSPSTARPPATSSSRTCTAAPPARSARWCCRCPAPAPPGPPAP